MESICGRAACLESRQHGPRLPPAVRQGYSYDSLPDAPLPELDGPVSLREEIGEARFVGFHLFVPL